MREKQQEEEAEERENRPKVDFGFKPNLKSRNSLVLIEQLLAEIDMKQ